MGQVVDLLNVMHVLLSLVLGVIVDLEWSLRSHEVRVGLRMIIGGNLLPIKRQTYYGSDIIGIMQRTIVRYGAVSELTLTLLLA